jgi:hypothetical protein
MEQVNFVWKKKMYYYYHMARSKRSTGTYSGTYSFPSSTGPGSSSTMSDEYINVGGGNELLRDWKTQFMAIPRGKKGGNQRAALGQAIKVHIHASGAVVREFKRPVLNALRAILRTRPGGSASSINNPWNPIQGWSVNSLTTQTIQNAAVGASKPSAETILVAKAVYKMIASEVRKLCPVMPNNNNNTFTNNTLWGGSRSGQLNTTAALLVCMQYDVSKKKMIPIGVSAFQKCGMEGLTGEYQSLRESGRLGEVSLVCGSSEGGKELALLAALARLASMTMNKQNRWRGIVVDCRNNPSLRTLLQRHYGFENVNGESVVGLKGDWRRHILYKMVDLRYNEHDEFSRLCPITVGLGVSYCW